MLQVLEFGRDVGTAVALPRFHHQLYPYRLQMEFGSSASLISDLRGLGHSVQELPLGQALAIEQAIVLVANSSTPQYGHIFAASDFRKNGFPSGY